MSPGRFLSFEGIDGAGKSSHIEALAAALRARGHRVVLTREPGGTPLAEALRDLFLAQPMDALTEALLVFASRRDHLRSVIVPALQRGDTVLCDRFTDATFAYQGGGRGFDRTVLSQLELWVQHVDGLGAAATPSAATDGGAAALLQPDLTLWFDLPPAVAAARRAAARTADRLEREDLDFFRRVADGYAAQGYLAVAPSTFHRVKPGVDLGYSQDDMGAGFALFTGGFHAHTLRGALLLLAIGLLATLQHMGRVTPGSYAIDTPVGTVQAHLHGNGWVEVDNVPAHRHLAGVVLDVPGYGQVVGDVAWGGNWFFLTDAGALPLDLAGVQDLTAFASAVRGALRNHRITGRDGAEIDHIELMGVAQTPGNSGRNFVLCPGGAYDRSPCGTGTSAKLACLAADGKLAEGERWLQESVVGSVFEGRYRMVGEQVLPSIRGQAHVVAETTLLLDRRDPFCWGLV